MLEKERIKTELDICENNRIQQLKKFGKLYWVFLGSCIETSEKQSKEYFKFASEFKNDILGQHFPHRYTHENLDRLLLLDHELILGYYELKTATNEDFIRVLSQLDYLKTIFSAIPRDIHEGNGKIVIDLTNQLISNGNKILQKSTEYLNTQKRDNPEFKKDELYNILDKIVIDYYKDNDGMPSPSWDYDKLINPIKKTLIKEPFRFMPICNDLLLYARHGGDIVFSIRQFNNQLCEDILNTTKRINSSIEKLKEIYGKLK